MARSESRGAAEAHCYAANARFLTFKGSQESEAKEMASINLDHLAGIQYSGVAGSSKDCQDAVIRLLQFGYSISHTRILTNENTHCLLVELDFGDLIAIKSGFASGFSGEGPSAFSYVLRLLGIHCGEITEHEVNEGIIDRLDKSALTISDIDSIIESKPIRPSRWYEYIKKEYDPRSRLTDLWRYFPHVIPFAVIDDRIADLALNFWDDPDKQLLTGYRRIEEIVRERTGLDEHGNKLFAKAFLGEEALLTWGNVDQSQIKGRANLFTSVFMAYRNPRAHREFRISPFEYLNEFLLLNHLFVLERSASEV